MASFVGVIAGGAAGVRYRKTIAVGDYLISRGNIDVNHSVRAEIIKNYLSTSNNFLLNHDLWKTISFIKGDESSGYWVNQKDLQKYITDFTKRTEILLLIAICLIAFGTIVYFLSVVFTGHW